MPHEALRVMFAVCFAACAGCAAPAPPAGDDAATLLGMHAAVLDAHLERDPDAWMALEADTVLVASRGEVFLAPREDRLAMRRNYLRATRFSVYRDLVPPVVRVSADGTVGWVVAQVEIAGMQERGDGGADSLGSTWAWIELYERRNGRWLMTGNVSNEKP